MLYVVTKERAGNLVNRYIKRLPNYHVAFLEHELIDLMIFFLRLFNGMTKLVELPILSLVSAAMKIARASRLSREIPLDTLERIIPHS